jgi:hypothetical protein
LKASIEQQRSDILVATDGFELSKGLEPAFCFRDIPLVKKTAPDAAFHIIRAETPQILIAVLIFFACESPV